MKIISSKYLLAFLNNNRSFKITAGFFNKIKSPFPNLFGNQPVIEYNKSERRWLLKSFIVNGAPKLWLR